MAALQTWAVCCCLAMAVFPVEARACDMTCCILVICLAVLICKTLSSKLVSEIA